MQTENLLLSSARSGTNFFLTVYSKCYPEDFVAKEIFRPKFDSLPVLRELLGMTDEAIKYLVLNDPKKLWQEIVETCRRSDRAALVKIFYYHVDHGSDLWAHFREKTRIVHLIRRNQFNVFLSHKVAQQTGKWQAFRRDGDDEEAIPPFAIDPTELREFFERQEEGLDWARKTFSAGAYQEVFYEDISDSPAECAAVIARIDGRKPITLKPTIGLKRQKKMPNSQIVANYKDVEKYDRPLF